MIQAVPDPVLTVPLLQGEAAELSEVQSKQGFLSGVQLVDPTDRYSFWFLNPVKSRFSDNLSYYPTWLGGPQEYDIAVVPYVDQPVQPGQAWSPNA